MPGRIRANGMAIVLFINQVIAFAMADAFLPLQKAYGYAPLLYALAFFAFIYFLTAVFLLPETKGKSLEEIERLFDRHTPVRSAASRHERASYRCHKEI